MASPHQQKIKVKGPVSVTANRLADGAVVWRTASGDWSEAIADAHVVTTADDALALLLASEADGVRAVGPYVATVALGADGRAQAANLREAIRSTGPTVALPGQG